MFSGVLCQKTVSRKEVSQGLAHCILLDIFWDLSLNSFIEWIHLNLRNDNNYLISDISTHILVLVVLILILSQDPF